jgi:diguanylate cyclase (GGDEF)-like protein
VDNQPDERPPLPDYGRGDGMRVDSAALGTVVNEFTATVTADFSLHDILRQLAVGATRVLHLAGAGVAAPGGDGQLLRMVFATEGPVQELESAQESLQQGPCHDSHSSGQIINLADIDAEGRWPAFQRHAVRLGVRAAAAIPLRARGRRWGVLDLYRTEPAPLSPAELEAATTLANLVTSYLVVAEDRDIARQAQAELADRAMHDTLTGLPVRWVFLDHLEHALSRLHREETSVTVLFIDLDGLKYINDTYGHAAGDRLIATSAERIRSALRPHDLLARIGGDEFIALITGLAAPGDAHTVAHRILARLAAPYQPNGQSINPSASIGIAQTTDPGLSGAALIAHADGAMYQAKRSNRVKVAEFDPLSYASDRNDVASLDPLVADLAAALEREQIEVHYQPIVEVPPADDGTHRTSHQMYAVEALMRWRHPARGLLTAAAFIEAAARTGMLPDLGTHVIKQACLQVGTWQRELGTAAPQRLFVNLSPSELAHPRLFENTILILTESGLDPEMLTVEITETDLVQHHTDASDTLNALRKVGCQLAIDDFGTGYSSLSRLIDIPAAAIKIDRSFTRALGRETNAAAVISAVQSLGRALDRTVIVEGVEDDVALRLLSALGIRYVQGFHTGPPMSVAELTSVLLAHR